MLRIPIPRTVRAACGACLVAASGLVAVATLSTGSAHAAMSLHDSDVTANLWSWNWNSVSRACTEHLGPAGYGAVQVAPPAESVSLASTSDGPHPWWEVYQPVSYRLSSRFGDRSAFAAMVGACHAAGVRVYVDAVVNHMAGSNNAVTATYGGSVFSPSGYSYPSVPYGYDDFHHPGDGLCQDEDGVIDNWHSASEVHNCELLSLSDLRTQSVSVRARLAGYLNDLIDLGVDGFRVDAAKHVAPADLAGLVGLLHRTTAENAVPYMAQEVIPGSGDPSLVPSAYTSIGSVLGFSYAQGLTTQFRNGTLSNLAGIGSWNLDAAGDRTAAMITNHDLEREGSTLRYLDGAPYTLATYFLLAYPYGRPFVYDGFAFSASRPGQSPPADTRGMVSDTDCSGGSWQCVTRSVGVRGMVGWHNATAAVRTVSDFTATSAQVIGFRRGGLGWVGFNASGVASTATYRTGLADGTYCDVVTGGAGRVGCVGVPVVVSGGTASVTIPAGGAVAIHGGARPGSGTAIPSPAASVSPSPSLPEAVPVVFNVHATTVYGTNVFVVGNLAEVGGWDPARAVPLSASGYPVWSGTVRLPARTAVEYKYIKKDPSGVVTWESGVNRTYTTGSDGAFAISDSWR